MARLFNGERIKASTLINNVVTVKIKDKMY